MRKDKVFLIIMSCFLIASIVLLLVYQNMMVSKNIYITFFSDARVREINEIDKTYDIASSTHNSNTNYTDGNTYNNTSNTYNLTDSDKEVIDYLNGVNDGIETSNTDKASVKDKAKKGFTTVVDFLFYGGTIKGKTFKELTDKGKMEAIKIGIKIEDKVNKHFPGLIDSMDDKYKSAKTKITTLYDEKTNEYCQKYPDNCDEFKSDYNDMKTSFGATFDLIKDTGSTIKSKISNWYQNKFKK